MKNSLKPIFLWVLLVILDLQSVKISGILFPAKKHSPRIPRQVTSSSGTIANPQPFYPVIANRALNVPIPTNIGYFPGSSSKADGCGGDEVLVEMKCQRILTQGSCLPSEEVLVDPETNKGYCAPRLCPPDRIFVHVTQMCHDPRDHTICPPGRELYYSAYGTPVCTCPDGTIEGDDDLDDDVCEILLGESLACLPGQNSSDSQEDESTASSTNNEPQVFWLKDFSSPPECLPDPCNGLNLKRKPNSLPFVPSRTGECFQLGQSEGVCPQGLYYSLAFDDLVGECNSLEDAGYNIFEPGTLEFLMNKFGSLIQSGSLAPHPTPIANVSGQINAKLTNVDVINNLVQGGKRKEFTKIQGQNSPISLFGAPSPDPSLSRLVQGPLSPPQGSILNNNNVASGFNGTNVQSNRFIQQTVQRPIGQTNKKIIGRIGQISTIQTGQKPMRQPVQKPISQTKSIPSGQSGNNSKEVCTFVHSPSGTFNQSGGIQGHKVCRTISLDGDGNIEQQQSIKVGVDQRSSGINPPEVLGRRGSSIRAFASFESTRPDSMGSYGYRFGRSLGLRPRLAKLIKHFTILPNGHRINHIIRSRRDISQSRRNIIHKALYSQISNRLSAQDSQRSKVLSRKRRRPLPHASPSNVFETRLLGCKPGARRDINSKCRTTVLPAQVPKQRGTRAAPPIPATPSCPSGMAFSVRRKCVPLSSAQNSIIGFNLG